MLNTTIAVPISSVGMHTLTINDNDSSFCVNITRLPALSNDYDGQWHIVPFAINLTPDYNVNETFYSINSGPISNVTADGQPFITSDGSNNTLEYWSIWNVYGVGIKETSHVTLTGIELDTIAPTGSVTISNSQVTTPIVTLNLYASDNVSGVSQMRLCNGDGQWSDWQPYISSITWNLQSGDGTKTVSVQYMDNAGLISPSYNAAVILQTPQVSPQNSQTISLQTTPSTSPTPTSTPTPSYSPAAQPSAVPVTPELNIQMVLILLAIVPLGLAVAYKRKNK